MSVFNQLEILGVMLVAGALSALIGFEREVKGKPAGLRTHILVGSAAALIVSIGPELVNFFEPSTDPGSLNVDPTRVIQAIVIAIGFIGGGAVLKNEDKMEVKHLTTAASILFSATIGILVAIHLWWVATGAALIVVVVNYTLRILERRYIKHSNYKGD